MKYLITIVLIGVIAFSCKKDPVETDPAKAILGKWECTAVGNGTEMIPVTRANGYTEFLSDSVVRIYESEPAYYLYATYWVDSLLNIGQIQDEGMQIITDRYTIYFTNNNNILRLESIAPFVTFHSSIYKRIN